MLGCTSSSILLTLFYSSSINMSYMTLCSLSSYHPFLPVLPLILIHSILFYYIGYGAQTFYNQMILVQRTQRVCVYEYEFEMHVTHCKVQVRFPCTFFLSWKTGNQTVEDNHQVKAVQDTIPFNSRLNLKLEVAYDQTAHVFLEKKTLLCVNLRPSSNPNEVRLVGTVPIDLANYLNSVNTRKNDINADDLRKYYMDRCPDKEGFLMLSIKQKYGRQIKASEMKQPTNQPNIAVPFLNLTGSRTPQPQRQRSASKQAILARIANLRKPLQTARARIQQTQPQKSETQNREIVSENIIPQQPQEAKEIVNNSSMEQPQYMVKLSDNQSKQSQQLHNLKTICSDLNSKLTNQHSFRVKLEVELEKTRLQNLQIRHIQKNLRKQLQSLKMVDHEQALKTLRVGLQRLQQELKEKSNRIEYLQGEMQTYRDMRSRKMSMEEVQMQTDKEQLQLMPSNQHFLDELAENKKKLQQLSVLHDTIQEDMINLTAENQKLKENDKIKQQQVESLKTQINLQLQSLKALDNLRQLLDETKSKLEHSEQQNQHLRVQLRQSQCHIMQMSPDPKIAENLVTRMHRSYSNMSMNSYEIAALKTMIEQKELIIKYLEQQRRREKSKIAKNQEDVGKLQAILIEARRKADNLERQLDESQRTIMKMRVKEITSKLVYNYNLSDNNLIEIGTQTQQDEISLPVTLARPSLQSQINKFKEQLHLSGQEQQNQLQDKIKQLEKQLEKQKLQVVDLTERNNLLERCVKKFQKQIGNHQKNIENQKAEIERMRRQSGGIRNSEGTETPALKEEILKKSKEITKLQHEVTSLQQQITNLNKEITQLKQLSTSQQREVSLLRQQTTKSQNTKQQLATLQHQKSQKQHQNQALKQQCIVKQSIINHKTKQLQQLSQKFHDIVNINQQNILKIQHLTQQKQSYQVRLNLMNTMASPIRKINQNAQPSNLMVELDELQQIIIALSGRNRQLNQKIRSISQSRMTFQQYARELSLELNKAKVRILNMAFDVESKKQCVLTLRPIQMKIDTILQFTKQLNATQDKSWTSSGDETDPAEIPNQQ